MKYFTLRELCFSETASRLGIKNEPSPAAMRNLHLLVDYLLDPIREKWGEPIIVTSGYRCVELNNCVRGVSKSQHLTGCAADLQSLGNNRQKNMKLYELIKQSGLFYDQLIAENSKHGGCDWVHVSFNPNFLPRRQAFLN